MLSINCTKYLFYCFQLSEIFKHSLGVGSAVVAFSLSSSSLLSQDGPPVDPSVEFHSLQYALFTTSFVEVLGGGFFLITSLYIERDRENAARELEGNDDIPHYFYFLKH